MRYFAILPVLLLAGCGGGTGGGQSGGGNLSSAFEDGFRSSYRTKFVESCVTSANNAAQQAGNGGAGVDFTAVCGCAADRLLATNTVSQLMSGPSEADQRAVMQACVEGGGQAPAPEASATPEPQPSARPNGPRGLHDI